MHLITYLPSGLQFGTLALYLLKSLEPIKALILYVVIDGSNSLNSGSSSSKLG
jgi:hypothetical protein